MTRHRTKLGSIARLRIAGGVAACVLVLCVLVGSPAKAHEGPPFPLVMDRPTDHYVVSVWTDPDIGEAKFFVIVDGPDGEPPEVEPAVSLWVEPTSGRLPRKEYIATKQPLRNRLQFEVHPYFDRGDMWTVGVAIAAGNGPTDFLSAEVESTPPGLGPWDLAIYLFPFLLLGGMWAAAIVRRRRAARRIESTAARGAAHV